MQHQKMLSLVARQVPAFVILFAGILVMLVYLLLGHYAHPSADDFCMAAGVQRDGLLPHLLHHYQEWSGRYASNTLYALYPLVFGFDSGYQLLPILVISLLFLSMAWFLAGLFRLPLRTPGILLATLVFLVIYLLGMRSVASGLYWNAGALTYQSGNILLLLQLGLMLRLVDRQEDMKRKAALIAVMVFVIIMGIGTHETNMIVVIGLLATAVIFQFHLGWSYIRLWLFLLLLALAASAVVFLSPGNLERAATFPMRHDLARSVDGSLAMGFRTLGIWLKSPLFIVSTLLAPFLVSALYRVSSRTIHVSKWIIFVLILVTVTAPFVLQFPAWWAMGGFPPARTVDAIYFVFLLGWFLTVIAITVPFVGESGILSQDPRRQVSRTVSLWILSVLWVAAIGMNGKFIRAGGDLLFRAAPYHEYMQDRKRLIRHAKVQQQFYLTVPAFDGEYPATIYYNDIRHDPRDWRNNCYAQYYGLQGIRRIQVQKPE